MMWATDSDDVEYYSERYGALVRLNLWDIPSEKPSAGRTSVEVVDPSGSDPR